MSVSDCLLFFVNGKRIEETRPNPEHTLLYYLRNVLGMKGTKMGCGEGGCGACTVMISKYDREDKKVIHMSIYACITPVCRVHGMAVTTVEGIGSIRTRLHPVQERIARFHGSQCGFCTPGIVMSMYTLLKNCPEPSQRQIEDAFDGNLCRCTGYRPILDGFKTFSCPKGENCCRVKKEGGMIETEGGMGEIEDLSPLDPSQDLIFPPELMLISSEKMLAFVGERVTWYRPTNLTEVLQLKQKHNDAKLVVGSTEVSVELRFKNAHYPIVMCPSEIPEMNHITILEDGILVGASVPLSEVFDKCQECVQTRPTHQTQVMSAIIDMLRKYGAQQIRNLACIGGNLITASPIADMNPILLAARCQLNIASAEKGYRVLPLEQSFFSAYRRVALESGEVLISVLIPWMSKDEYFNAYKQARRRDDDISIVSSACWLKIRTDDTTKSYIEDCRLVFGGMAPITKLADKTSTSLIGCEWNRHVCERGLELLKNELSLPLDVPGGMPEYREVLAASFFFKFYLYVTQLMTHSLQPEYVSGMNGVSLPLTESTQAYEEVPGDQTQYDPVGRPIVFQSAYQQATGEAKYVDDIPTLTGELYAAPVLSSRAHARILSIDVEDTLAIPGVHYVITHKDIPAGGSNDNGLFSDEELFAESEVMCYGQLIGLVIAEDPLIARRAARTVNVSYENLPTVVTIEEAIKSNSFIDFTHIIARGDSSVISDCENVDSGEIRIGGQEHFYLEPQSCIVIPTEDGDIEMISSTQILTTCQLLTAKALGIQANKIVCKVKRIGGGFGGKQTRSCVLSAAVAVAANKLLRPIRCVFDRDDDMKHTGGRHPFLAKYKVGYQSDGKITALIVDLYSNAGMSSDLSPGVMDKALFHMENAYNIPNVRVSGHLCRTNLPSNTAFRGFGGPQSMFVIESIIGDISQSLKKPPNEVRWNNFYVDGNTTPYGMPIISCQMQRCWEELLEKSNYSKLVEETAAFNKQNKFIKRGVSVIPTKYGISFAIASFNQGGALVHIIKDGSVLVAHGGIEMGQGLYTKMIQVCSKSLAIPISKIYINETSTNTVANMSPSAASMSSDIYGRAILNACEILNSRLAAVKKNNSNKSWDEWINIAYLDRINLSAQGFCKIENLDFDWSNFKGSPFNYFTYGCGCSLVEVDVLTGDFKVLKTDIVMDVGKSINPAVDVGQIEGAFVQGMGLFTMEEMVYLNEGRNIQKGTVFTCGPGTYKIPCFGDVPANLRVYLLHNAPNERAVYSSKGIGEPPMILGASVLFAIKDAITNVRRDNGAPLIFRLNSPATSEQIRMLCSDFITKRFLNEKKEGVSEEKWTVVP